MLVALAIGFVVTLAAVPGMGEMRDLGTGRVRIGTTAGVAGERVTMPG